MAMVTHNFLNILKLFVLIVFMLACTGPDLWAADKSPNRTALIIGNDDYKFSPLKNPVNDAKDMAEALSALQFKIIKCINCNEAQIRESVRKFDNALRESHGCGVVYYAGHGVQVRGENYLIPVGVDLLREYEVMDNCVSLSSILGSLETAQNRLNIVILDACRNNPFQSSFRSASKGLAKVDAPIGTLVAYATGPGSVAKDGEADANGLYTSTLLKYIQIEGLPVEEVFKRTRKEVMQKTNNQQIPWESTCLTGTFTFKGETKISEEKISEQLAYYKDETETNAVEAAEGPDEAESEAESEATLCDFRSYNTALYSNFIEIPNRFIKISDHVVYDKYLKREWFIIKNKIFNWDEAKEYAEEILGSRYRLPTLDELKSLTTKTRGEDGWGRINNKYFPSNDRSHKYWTGTGTTQFWANAYWYLDFEEGAAAKMSGSNYCSLIVIRQQ